MPRRSPPLVAIALLCAGTAQAQLSGYNPVACTIQYERAGFNELMQLCRSNPDAGVATGFRAGTSSIRCHELQAWANGCGWPYKPLPPLPQARATLRPDPSRPSPQPGDAAAALPYDLSRIGGFRPYDEPLVVDPPRQPWRGPAQGALRHRQATPPERDQTGQPCLSALRLERRELGGGKTAHVLVLASSTTCAAASLAIWARGTDGRHRTGSVERGATGELACVTSFAEARPCYGLVDWGEGVAPSD